MIDTKSPEVMAVLKDIYSAPVHERKYMMKRLREAINGKKEAETITLFNWRTYAK